MTERSSANKVTRVALVTGGTRGIGRAIADALREDGQDVYVVARRTPNGGDGRELDAGRMLLGDLTEPGAAGGAVRAVLDRAGRLDVLVNNAGMQHVAPVEGYPHETWARMVALHMTAPFHAISASLGAMRKQQFGRIVNIASVHGLVATEGKAPYSATKHGLVGLTKAVALETANEPITCNAVCPGFVRTALIDDQIDTLAKEHGLGRSAATHALLKARQPSAELVEPGAVAALVRYLCSEVARDVTGVALPIDGGWTAR